MGPIPVLTKCVIASHSLFAVLCTVQNLYRSKDKMICISKALLCLSVMLRTSAPVNLLRALNYDASCARNGLFLRPPSPLIVPGPVAGVTHNDPTSVTDVNHNGPTFFKSQVGFFKFWLSFLFMRM